MRRTALRRRYGRGRGKRELSVPDKHQLRVLKDTVRNPLKGLLGGPSAAEAEDTLRSKFGFTEEQIRVLRAS